MNKRKIKKKNIAYWYLISFTDDLAVYKICSNCLEMSTGNYTYKDFKLTVFDQDNYCYSCGKRMSLHPICRKEKQGVYHTKCSIFRRYEGGLTLDELFGRKEIKNEED